MTQATNNITVASYAQFKEEPTTISEPFQINQADRLYSPHPANVVPYLVNNNSDNLEIHTNLRDFTTAILLRFYLNKGTRLTGGETRMQHPRTLKKDAADLQSCHFSIYQAPEDNAKALVRNQIESFASNPEAESILVVELFKKLFPGQDSAVFADFLNNIERPFLLEFKEDVLIEKLDGIKDNMRQSLIKKVKEKNLNVLQKEAEKHRDFIKKQNNVEQTELLEDFCNYVASLLEVKNMGERWLEAFNREYPDKGLVGRRHYFYHLFGGCIDQLSNVNRVDGFLEQGQISCLFDAKEESDGGLRSVLREATVKQEPFAKTYEGYISKKAFLLEKGEKALKEKIEITKKALELAKNYAKVEEFACKKLFYYETFINRVGLEFVVLTKDIFAYAEQNEKSFKDNLALYEEFASLGKEELLARMSYDGFDKELFSKLYDEKGFEAAILDLWPKVKPKSISDLFNNFKKNASFLEKTKNVENVLEQSSIKFENKEKIGIIKEVGPLFMFTLLKMNQTRELDSFIEKANSFKPSAAVIESLEKELAGLSEKLKIIIQMIHNTVSYEDLKGSCAGTAGNFMEELDLLFGPEKNDKEAEESKKEKPLYQLEVDYRELGPSEYFVVRGNDFEIKTIEKNLNQ